MKDIEKKISHFIENQFPSFYKEEGPQFIAFIKAYYEWLEREDNPLYESRRLTQYRDVDETMEEFILYFKEKYLKNIQFDTATNKILLVKNSLDLYRSKGSERSIDLFFKLVYGTDADVSYPADNILRPSDGVWEKPLYLEISSSRFNIDYVGKQIIGSESNATAFVERFIRRKTNKGYVNLLYVSEVVGTFTTGEIIGLNINSVPTIDLEKRARLLGSIDSVILQDRGRGFSVGDLVTFESDYRGVGGLARVAGIETSSGIIDFDLLEGGWGYTIDADAIVSEKVITAGSVITDPTSKETFKIFEQIVEPLANLSYTSASGNMEIGDKIFRYSAGVPVAEATIIDIDQASDVGTMTVSHSYGTFVNTETYYTEGNAESFFANTVENRSIAGTVMGIPSIYTFSLNNQVGTLNVGDQIFQSNTQATIATGTITNITQTPSGNVIVVGNTTGSFKRSKPTADFFYTSGTGTITTYAANALVTGVGTSFNNNYLNAVIYSDSNTALGEVASVVNSTALILKTNATGVVTNNTHSYGLLYPIKVQGSTATANISTISTTVGVYQIREEFTVLSYSGASGTGITNTSYVYQYDVNNNETAKAKVVIGDYDAGSGNLSVVLVKGYFEEGEKIYTDANAASADLNVLDIQTTGGDFIGSGDARMYTYSTNTEITPTALSFGSGADFNVGAIGDTETIFVGTDTLGSNNEQSINFERKTLTIASNTGFGLNDFVYQEVNKIAFNPSTDYDEVAGTLTLPTANTRFLAGDVVKYTTAPGNTAIVGFSNNETLYVLTSNSTTVTITPKYNREVPLSTAISPDVGTGAPNEVGHFIHKVASGKVFELGATVARVKNNYNQFGVTAAGANTTTYGNSNLIVYGNDAVNTAISVVSDFDSIVVANQAYMSLQLTSDVYGFPKNTQGNFEDIIYNCLTYQSFTLGSVGTLTGVDPGSEYNIDPYVLVYQPIISALNRKDFIINVANATSSYVIGEKINQSSSNLIFFDVQVDSGVFANTYVQKNISFNSDHDVDSANDFIYVPGTTYSFNANTDVDDLNDFITIANSNLVDGDIVRYYTGTGNTALSGLTNNALYYVVGANSSSVQVSATAGGANVNIVPSATVESGHFFLEYDNTLSNGDTVLYSFPLGNTSVGFANSTLYYVVNSNTSGFALATTSGGANVNITANTTGGETHTISTVAGYLPNERVYQAVLSNFNSNTSVDNVNEFITISPQPYSDGDEVTYYTSTGNTVLTGLANNGTYYVVAANSTGIKLSNTVGGGAIDITASATSETGHNILAVANATVKFVFKDGANSFIRISDVTNTFANNYEVFSYTNEYLDGLASNVATVIVTSTATGIIKEGSNSSVLRVKRLSYENTFQPGLNIVGTISGANSTIVSVAEDQSVQYPIGLNANVSANVVTANGQISSLQVIDSGFGFSNSEIVQYTSSDGSTSGTIKLVKGGLGRGRGYYRSSKGFLSADMYIHDGDFYQEYSYEVLSKISFDKYESMFKKVMHVAGTKFFGSIRIIENANVNLTLAESSITQANTV